MVTFNILNHSSLTLMILLLSIYVKLRLITCEPLLEIPFIRKTLQEYRKKVWHEYHHKLFIQCMGGRTISRSKDILSVTEVLEHLYRCLVTQHEEIYKAPQRIKEVKLSDWKADLNKTGVLHANRSLHLK